VSGRRVFKAVLHDAPDVQPPKQLLYASLFESEQWAKQVIDGLTVAQKEKAFVVVSEMREVPVLEVHAAKIPGEYAVARIGE